MMEILARTYIVVLFLIEVLLLAASLLLHVSVWMGLGRLYTEFGEVLLVGSLFAALVSCFLAKERNVWKNEFKRCPLWARGLAVSVGIYGLALALWRTVLFPDAGGSEDLITLSAIPLSVNAMCLCIPYAVAWTKSVGTADLIRRSIASFAAAIVGVVIIAAYHAGYLARSVR
jgi:hypothetical protein